ncbi:insulin-like growth factor-binding protein 6 [Perognathus longimembris pacificus]|uniref:insulin-like growth factor-binding protein 6 n=1 Tax=Perognathus longimembris pacificus TaxID=214514 RepID=UPI002019A637|nr:insulin-like growth factor-binding protein 6 [Perognathus longimembris pacificus]
MTPYGLLPPLLLLTLLLAAHPESALARCPGCRQAVQEGCPGGCLEEEAAKKPAMEGCAETGDCVRREGQLCGVYTPYCTPGLQCQPTKDEETPLRALLLGRGRCLPVRKPSGENPKESKPHRGATRSQGLNRRDQQRNPEASSTPSRPNPGGVQDTDMGPCRRHLDSVLQQLQTEIFRGTQPLYVPNCDHQGFYQKHQCRSSRGHRRGPCWCVDRMGQPLPGSPDGDGSFLCPTGNSG